VVGKEKCRGNGVVECVENGVEQLLSKFHSRERRCTREQELATPTGVMAARAMAARRGESRSG
jgi:hypothetical protein